MEDAVIRQGIGGTGKSGQPFGHDQIFNGVQAGPEVICYSQGKGDAEDPAVRRPLGSLRRRQSSLVEEAEDFFLTGEERELLKRVGENFGYLDTQMQLKNLELYIGQTEALIQKAQEELRDRQRTAGALSLMCGLFLVILLI